MTRKLLKSAFLPAMLIALFFANTVQVQAADDLKIISRGEWGADEELRIWNPDRYQPGSGSYVNPCADIEERYGDEFELTQIKEYTPDGQPLTWPLQYAKTIEKFAIHHTDSDVRDLNGDSITDTRDYREMLRLIYNFHTLSRGWGDIGYNYIIDPLGNIYEGRYGGDKVIGAHSLCYNHGVIGIAVIGDYENSAIPEPAQQALTKLIAVKSKQYGIDPSKTTDFRGKRLSNVFAHRNVRATTCPGDAFYAMLPEIRNRSALAMQSFSESSLAKENLDYNAELVGTIEKLDIGPGQRETITVKFKNTGKKTWDEDTWLHVALNNNSNARIVPAVESKNFVAADLEEKSVAPGKTGTFKVEIEGGYKSGHYAFQVSPVINGRYKISRASQYVSMKVDNANNTYEIVEHHFPSGTVFQGEHIFASLKLKNTGNTTWRNYGANPITLGASAPKDRPSIFIKDNPYRVGYMADSEVAPGETGEFILDLSIPEDREGEVIERFTPVVEGVEWLADKALGFKVNIKEPKHLAKTTKLERLGYMYPGERRYVTIEMENKGDLPWDSSTVQTTLLGRGMKVFKRMLYPPEKVEPGEKTIIGFWVEAPMVAGQHEVYLRSRFNKNPIQGAVAKFVVEVPSPELRGVKVAQSESFIELAQDKAKEVTVQFKNTGNTVWKKKGYHAVHLGTSNPTDRSSRLHDDSWLSEFRVAELQEEEVMPGDLGTFKFMVEAGIRGRFEEDFQLVMERYGWIAGTNVRFVADVNRTVASTTNTNTSSKTSTTIPTANVYQASTASIVSVPEAKADDSVDVEVETISEQETAPATTENKIDSDIFRVKISHEATLATLTMDKAYIVADGDNKAMFNMAANKEISIRKIGSEFEVKSGYITKKASIVRIVPKDEAGVVEILTMERRPTWNTSLNDNKFRGTMEMRILDGKVAYINELPLEDYLHGLAEVSNDAPLEKMKTIAVLARTYARFYMSEENRKFPGMPYDGSDDPAIFQRYLGYGVEIRSPNFVSAVEATEDVVVTYEGELVKTPYFNQSDGRTRSAQEVWGWTHTPYLQSVPDPWSEGLSLNGHGVGLSGLGATQQAEDGKSFDEIIKYYYTGVEVEKQNF